MRARRKDTRDLTGVETYVWNLLQSGDTGWVPIRNSAVIQSASAHALKKLSSLGETATDTATSTEMSRALAQLSADVDELKREMKKDAARTS